MLPLAAELGSSVHDGRQRNVFRKSTDRSEPSNSALGQKVVKASPQSVRYKHFKGHEELAEAPLDQVAKGPLKKYDAKALWSWASF